MKTQLENYRAQIQDFKSKYDKYIPAIFFIAGFLFDILTLSRIDDWLTIIQQSTYILILIQILKFRTLESAGLWTPSEKISKWWKHNDAALHFFIGSLLSSYTLFYFVSSSLATSFFFMAFIFTLLIGNELPQLQNKGLRLKYALFSICIFSFLYIVIPITIGFIGVVPFLIATVIGLILIFAFYKSLESQWPKDGTPKDPQKGTQEEDPNGAPKIKDLQKTILWPSGMVAATLVILYALKILPPIPLSVQHIGIYHQIEKAKIERDNALQTQFILKYDRPFWKFWQNGAQDFIAEPGDKIFCFVRIFAPSYFKDRVIFHWLKKYPKGWQTADKIPNDISGGRDEGFRGYAIKSNYEPGEWRVQIETTDGREIGRINFSVSMTTEKNPHRELKTEVH